MKLLTNPPIRPRSFLPRLCLTLCLLAPAAGVAAPKDCTLEGKATLGPDIQIVDDVRSVIATFTGAPIAIRLGSLPRKPGEYGRVVTSPNGPGFRIEGGIDTRKVPLHNRTDITVVPDHVWIPVGSDVRAARAQGAELEVFRRLRRDLNQTVHGWAECSSLSLEPLVPGPHPVPGAGREYRTLQPLIALYAGPQSPLTKIFELRSADHSRGLVVRGTETRGDLRHIHYRGDLLVDAWVKSSDLEPLSADSLAGRARPPQSRYRSPKPGIGAEIEIVRLERAAPVRLRADPRAPKVGAISAGTEIYVLDVVMGWASVLPKALNLAAPAGSHFYVPAAHVRNMEPEHPRELRPPTRE
jgi:hypothetical protein